MGADVAAQDLPVAVCGDARGDTPATYTSMTTAHKAWSMCRALLGLLVAAVLLKY